MSDQDRNEWSNDLRNKYGIAQPEDLSNDDGADLALDIENGLTF